MPAGSSVPVAELNTIADMLATCVNSPGGTAGDGSACGNLFSWTTQGGGVVPTNTFTAALALARNPALNTTSLFGLVSASSPFQPVLSGLPQDFSVGLTTNSGLRPSVSNVSFPSTATGSTSATQTFTLTNSAGSPIPISGISLSGINAGEFVETDNCPSTLAVGSNCTVQLSFSPFAVGSRVALLSVANSSSSELFVDLNGTATAGAAPQITAETPSSISLGQSTMVTLNGTNFTPSSAVYLNGYYLLTSTFISPQGLSVTVPSQYLYSTGSITLVVRNGNSYSNTVTLPVVNATPTLSSISPSTVLAGSPNFTLTLTGTNITSSTTVSINGTTYTATTATSTSISVYVAASQLTTPGSFSVTLSNPTPGGGISNAQTLQVVAPQNRLRTLNYTTNDIASDNVNHLLYASVSSTSTLNPNTIIAIDPLQGVVVATQSMPAQPTILSATDDGSYLYVSLPSTGTISRLILPSLTPDISWSLGSSGYLVTPRDLQAAPGAPHTVAVTGVFSSSANGGTVTVYDDGIARPSTPVPAYPSPSFDSIAWGNDATTMYGSMAVTSGGPEYVFSVNQGGVTLSNTLQNALGNFVARLTYDKTSGRLFDGYGDVIKASTGASAGKFAVQNTLSYEQNPFAISAAQGKAFFLNTNSTVSGGGYGFTEDIQAFDLNQYNFLDAMEIPNLTGSRIVSWGATGIAVGGGSQIFIIDGPFVSSAGTTSQVGGYVATSPTLSSISPQTIPVGSGSTTVTLTGSNFTAASVVTWNNLTFPVTAQSATQVSIVIPSSALTSAISSDIFISNGPGTENSTGIAFTVLPNLGPNVSIQALDVSGADMVADPLRGLLYIAATNSVGPYANSIVTVDPASATVKASVYTGGGPRALGISDDGTVLYAAFESLPVVERFSLADFSLNLTFPLNAAGSSLFACDVKVAPGQNQTVAVSLFNPQSNYYYSEGPVSVYDNGTPRPNTAPSFYPGNCGLAWGKDASTFILGDIVLPVNASGFSSSYIVGQSSGTGLRPHYDAGTSLVYGDGGGVFNPVNGNAAGQFATGSTLVVPDSSINRAFVLTASTQTTYILSIYNLQQQTLLNTITLPVINGYPFQMVRWGAQGLAILTYNFNQSGVGQLYLLQGSEISGLVTPPAGSIALNPANALVGSSVGAIAVTGTGFLSTSVVLVNGTARPTTFVSSSQLTFQPLLSDLSNATYLNVVVSNSATGGSDSLAASFGVLNPGPANVVLGTPTLPLNASNSTLSLTGTGFLPTSTVTLNGSSRTITYVSPTQLTVTLGSFDTATLGSDRIVVTNPGPGGGTSPVVFLQIVNPNPAVTALSPAVIATGSPAQSVSVLGSGFTANSTVQVNGITRAFTFSSSTQLQVPLSAADFATTGAVPFVVTNPAPGGGTSNTFKLFVRSGLPGNLTITPSSLIQGTATPTLITVNGSNFVQGTTLAVGGVFRATNLLSSTQLTFTATVADQAYATNLFITGDQPCAKRRLDIGAPAGRRLHHRDADNLLSLPYSVLCE